MDWTNPYDPTIGKDKEVFIYIDEKPYMESELIKGVWGIYYSREQVDKMNVCEQIQKIGKIITP